MSLFPNRIEHITGDLVARGPIRVPHGANADYVIDTQGRSWVRKKEIETGFNCLLAEAFGALLASELSVPSPDCAVHRGQTGKQAWLSRLMPDITHWDPAKIPFIENLDELGSMIALDAILINEDRHRGNILLQSVGEDSEELHAWSIDLGNALVGWPSDFHGATERIPDPRNHARGFPVHALEDIALETAHEAMTISSEIIREYSQEACGLVQEPTIDDYAEVLYSRCRNAVQIVSTYLVKLKRLS